MSNKDDKSTSASLLQNCLLADVLAALDTVQNKEELIAIRAKAQSLSDAEFDEFGKKYSIVNAQFMTEDEKRGRREMADSLWQRLRQNIG